jgi:hypothetical protein
MDTRIISAETQLQIQLFTNQAYNPQTTGELASLFRKLRGKEKRASKPVRKHTRGLNTLNFPKAVPSKSLIPKNT